MKEAGAWLGTLPVVVIDDHVVALNFRGNVIRQINRECNRDLRHQFLINVSIGNPDDFSVSIVKCRNHMRDVNDLSALIY